MKATREFGPWSEQCSSQGKIYYYNKETEISQWEKPEEWREYDRQQQEFLQQQQQEQQEEERRKRRLEEEREPPAKVPRQEPVVDPFLVYYDPSRARKLYGVGEDIVQLDQATREFSQRNLELSMRTSQELGLRKSASSLVKTAQLRTVVLDHKIRGVRNAQTHLEEKRREKEKENTTFTPYMSALTNNDF